MLHRNARFTRTGRRVIIECVLVGRPTAPCRQEWYLADLRPPLDGQVPCPWLGRSSGPQLHPTCAGFLTRAAAAMAAKVHRFAHRLSRDFQDALVQLGAKHILIKLGERMLKR